MQVIETMNQWLFHHDNKQKTGFGGFTGQTYVFWLVVWNMYFFPIIHGIIFPID